MSPCEAHVIVESLALSTRGSLVHRRTHQSMSSRRVRSAHFHHTTARGSSVCPSVASPASKKCTRKYAHTHKSTFSLSLLRLVCDTILWALDATRKVASPRAERPLSWHQSASKRELEYHYTTINLPLAVIDLRLLVDMTQCGNITSKGYILPRTQK